MKKSKTLSVKQRREQLIGRICDSAYRGGEDEWEISTLNEAVAVLCDLLSDAQLKTADRKLRAVFTVNEIEYGTDEEVPCSDES